MNTKEWLNRARTLDKEIDALESARVKAMERCLSITAKPRDIVVSGGVSDQDSRLVAYADLSRQIDEMVDKLCDTKTEILKAIQTVDDGTLRTLLVERYINIKTWEQIAVDMNKSYQWVCELHGRALEKVLLLDGN